MNIVNQWVRNPYYLIGGIIVAFLVHRIVQCCKSAQPRATKSEQFLSKEKPEIASRNIHANEDEDSSSEEYSPPPSIVSGETVASSEAQMKFVQKGYAVVHANRALQTANTNKSLLASKVELTKTAFQSAKEVVAQARKVEERAQAAVQSAQAVEESLVQAELEAKEAEAKAIKSLELLKAHEIQIEQALLEAKKLQESVPDYPSVQMMKLYIKYFDKDYLEGIYNKPELFNGKDITVEAIKENIEIENEIYDGEVVSNLIDRLTTLFNTIRYCSKARHENKRNNALKAGLSLTEIIFKNSCKFDSIYQKVQNFKNLLSGMKHQYGYNEDTEFVGIAINRIEVLLS